MKFRRRPEDRGLDKVAAASHSVPALSPGAGQEHTEAALEGGGVGAGGPVTLRASAEWGVW